MRLRKDKMVEEKTKFQLLPFDDLTEPYCYPMAMIIDDDEMDEDYKFFLLNHLNAAPNKTCRENDNEMAEDYKRCLLKHLNAAPNKTCRENDYEMAEDYKRCLLKHLNAAPNKTCREKDDEMDEDFNLSMLTNQMAAATKGRREYDDDEVDDDDRYHEEVNDPDYELFLENLEVHEKSYMLKSEGEENGSIVRVCIKYDEIPSPDREENLEPRRKLIGDSNQIPCLENQRKHDSQKFNSDEEWDLEPGRKLRSAAKHINEDSTQILGLENHRKHDFSQKFNSDKEWDLEPRRKLRSAAKHINEDSTQILGLENHRKRSSRSTPAKATVKLPEGKLGNNTNSEKRAKLSISLKDEGEYEGDFRTWLTGVEVFGDDDYVYKCGDHIVEYNKTDQEYDLANEEYNDESSSDVEYLGCKFDTEENSDFSKIIKGLGMDNAARFRWKVITALRKPYNRKEYDGLLQAIKYRRLEERHLDLRHGRERSYAVQKEGKSYLDYYPDFGKKLLQEVDDKPRRLNLLRGFFIWLKYPGMLPPWKDAELLAIKPRSG